MDSKLDFPSFLSVTAHFAPWNFAPGDFADYQEWQKGGSSVCSNERICQKSQPLLLKSTSTVGYMSLCLVDYITICLPAKSNNFKRQFIYLQGTYLLWTDYFIFISYPHLGIIPPNYLSELHLDVHLQIDSEQIWIEEPDWKLCLVPTGKSTVTPLLWPQF